jgi:hypothetical protein
MRGKEAVVALKQVLWLRELRDGRPRNRGSTYGKGKRFLFSTASKTGSGPHPAFRRMDSEGKAAGA